VIVLTASDVERLLPLATAIPLMRDAMRQVSAGDTVLPLRQFMAVPGGTGKLAVMPGYVAEPASFGVKIVSKFPRAPGDRHGTHVGAVLIFGAADGLPLALIDGATLTAIRTAATSAMATDVLARTDVGTLLVIGCGEQAHRHIDALREVRALERVMVWGRDRSRAADLADKTGGIVAVDLDAAVAAADVICTTTSAVTPILHGATLRPGTHVNLVGSAVATSAEADSEVVRRSRFFVDARPAALAAAGELLDAIASGVVDEDHIAGEIGEVLLGRVSGRQSADEITVYKSLGVTAQDLVAAHAIWRRAVVSGAGTKIDLAA
jgi:ornithine cyclodeaminase/alanine dehydrogenase-like protein (mu-crystallin family)